MKKKINGVLYDTAAASLIAETVSMAALSGNVSIGLFKSHSGQWFQTVDPVKGGNYSTISNWISANTARRWLEKHSCYLQLRVYFGDSDTPLKSERQILVAERNSPNSTNAHELVEVERLYHHPEKGWCLKQTKEAVLIPLTVHEAVNIAKTLQVGEGHIQNRLPSMETYMYERGHLYHGRI